LLRDCTAAKVLFPLDDTGQEAEGINVPSPFPSMICTEDVIGLMSNSCLRRRNPQFRRH
jgi:hypothetical protein